MSKRIREFWVEEIQAAISSGKENILVVAHGNALRSLVAQLEGLGPEEAATLSVPRCAPLHYRLQRLQTTHLSSERSPNSIGELDPLASQVRARL